MYIQIYIYIYVQTCIHICPRPRGACPSACRGLAPPRRAAARSGAGPPRTTCSTSNTTSATSATSTCSTSSISSTTSSTSATSATSATSTTSATSATSASAGAGASNNDDTVTHNNDSDHANHTNNASNDNNANASAANTSQLVVDEANLACADLWGDQRRRVQYRTPVKLQIDLRISRGGGALVRLVSSISSYANQMACCVMLYLGVTIVQYRVL